MVMQYPEYQLFEETVAKDIAYGPTNMGLSEEEIRERVFEAAIFAGLPSELLEKSPFDLSGGQKRRVAIAGIMAMRPDVLVLDEPAAGLDPRGRESIFANIVEYQKKSGTTVVIVSHSMEDMARLCDFLLVMEHGKVAMSGTPDEIFSDADRLSAIGLDIPQITKLLLLLREQGFVIPEKAVRQGLKSVRWPASFELICNDPVVIFDGGHNPQGVEAAVKSIGRYFPEEKVNLISGVMADKAYDEMINLIKPVAEQVFTVTPNNPRALASKDYAAYFEAHKVKASAYDTVEDGIRAAIKDSRESGRPLICLGSLYLYEEFYDKLQAISAEEK
jgi:ABC-type multidrug transport system ATPase subunit